MATLIGSGIGSGLDIGGIVAKLVEAEGRPQATRLSTQEAKAQGKLSALGSLRSALETFRTTLASLKDIDKFRGREVVLSAPERVAVTATPAAFPSRYAIEVQQLAEGHKLVSAANAFATRDDVVGTGTLTLTTGGETFAVTIDESNNTLAGIAAAINRAADNTGIAATVITGVDGARLVLAARETGVEHAITVAASDGDGGLAALVYDPVGAPEDNGLEELQAAQNARVLVDGLAVESASNSIEGAIEGVTIDLLSADEPGATTLVTIGFDKRAARAQIEQFVKSYNALQSAVASATGFDPQAGVGAPLSGDATVRGIATKMRMELNSALTEAGVPFALLSQIGVTSDVKGELSIDAARLDEAFATDFDAVGALFATAETGLAVRLDAALAPYLGSGGLLDARNQGLNATIRDIGQRRTALEQRLAAVEERLFRQFNALDTLLAELQSTSNFLTQQLNQLPGAALLNNRKK